MGLLNRNDSTIFRQYFSEMCKLIGISVGYQYVTKKCMTIHSEDNSELSMPIRINILFDENPSVDTLNRLGWISEINDQKPIIANLPYNTPHLAVNCRLTVESSDGVARPRVFRITKLASDLEFPDAYTCAIVPVYDQLPQDNAYTLVNETKIDTDDSKRTSKEQPYTNISGNTTIDTVPDENKLWHDTYKFISDDSSPYSDN